MQIEREIMQKISNMIRTGQTRKEATIRATLDWIENAFNENVTLLRPAVFFKRDDNSHDFYLHVETVEEFNRRIKKWCVQMMQKLGGE